MNPWAVIFNRAFSCEVPHMILAAYMVAGFLVAAVCAAGMLRGRRSRYHRLGQLIPFTAVLAGPGFLLLFTLRHRQKLSGEDERDVTEADIPGLRAAGRAAAGTVRSETAVRSPSAQHPGTRALALAAVAFLAGISIAAAGTTRSAGKTVIASRHRYCLRTIQ